MYLAHPNHLPITPGSLPNMSTHPVDVDDSNRKLEESAAAARLTRSYGRVEAVPDESERPDIEYME